MFTLANQLTLLRMALSPIIAMMVLSTDAAMVELSPFVFGVAALTDWYDGKVARAMRTETRLGRFLDPLADKFLTAAAFLAFVALGLIPLWMVMVLLGRDVVVTLLRVWAEASNRPLVTARASQAKTFLQLVFITVVVCALAAQHNPWLAARMGGTLETIVKPGLVSTIMFGLTAFSAVTGVAYLIENRLLFRSLYAGLIRTPAK